MQKYPKWIKMDGLYGKILLKWMMTRGNPIYGTPHMGIYHVIILYKSISYKWGMCDDTMGYLYSSVGTLLEL